MPATWKGNYIRRVPGWPERRGDRVRRETFWLFRTLPPTPRRREVWDSSPCPESPNWRSFACRVSRPCGTDVGTTTTGRESLRRGRRPCCCEVAGDRSLRGN